MFFVLFFASQCFAQAPFIDNKLSFGTSILKYIDPYKGTLVNAGIDVKIYDRISWYSELGFFTPSLFGFNPTPNNRGFAVVQELKIFQDSKTKCSGSYLAASIFYSNQFYNRTDSIYPTSAPPTEKQYDLHRQVVAATFSIGELMTFENGLNINFYVGAGGLINIVQNSLT